MNVNLDTRVRIEQKSVSQDQDYGTDIVTWTHLATVWAEVQDALPSRSEAVKMGLAVATRQTRVRIRYRSDLDSSMRLVIWRPDPEVYEVVGGPSEIGRHEYSEIVVERISS